MVERFNATLKSMLRKLLQKFNSQWDKALPYLFFTYREVPQAATGFSPFELLYGCQVRGPLDVLHETWEEQTSTPESVVSFVQNVQERLTFARKAAQQNEMKAKKEMKIWYDRTARERSFAVGDMVLVLLPSESNKLRAKWQGPYPVVEKVSETTCRVRMSDQRKKIRGLHKHAGSMDSPPSRVHAGTVKGRGRRHS